MNRLALAIVATWISLGLAKAETLPNTAALTWPEADLSERLMDGAHAFVERKIGDAKETRARYWNYDFSSPAAYEKSVAPNRERFREIIGVVDERVSPVSMERFGDAENPALVAETPEFRVFQVRWPVLPGVWSEGLLVEPSSGRKGTIVLIPDADETPEQLLGLANGDAERRKSTRHLAHAGFRLVIPALIDRRRCFGPDGEDSRLKRSDQTHREWIYRQAFHMGRHVIGYEVQKVLAAVDWAERVAPGESVAVSGYGEGGLIAFYAAACDPRIRAAHVAGYFGSREGVWREPIYRNVFGLLREFGDAEISSLIPPRALLVEAVAGPAVTEQKGELQPKTELSGEFARFGQRPFAFAHRAEVSALTHGLRPRFFAEPEASTKNPHGYLENGRNADLPSQLVPDKRTNFDPNLRHARLFRLLENHVQSLVRASDSVREEWFLFQAEPKLRPGRWSTNAEHPTLDPANFIANAKPFRKRFHEEAMGNFDEPFAALNPRSRKVAETEKWTAWDVVLDVYPEFFAWGTLVLPKDLKPGEKRPVVVCQHGRNGVPRDTIDAANPAYNDFAAKLAERGFITFAPHNLYRGEDRYRWLDRKANAIGCTLFSFIIPSHRRILDWLKTQPNVDAKRIAFYGLSYGGETAVRVPPVLEDYAVVICSGDFNQWTRKVAATDFPNGFMRTIEWEMPYWNLGPTFDYAEMAYLIFPRPFMVERGHHDRVSRDRWVAHEYAKVRWLYAQFGMAERTEIEFFQGGHSIRGEGTFRFLHRHLDWPQPREPKAGSR